MSFMYSDSKGNYRPGCKEHLLNWIMPRRRRDNVITQTGSTNMQQDLRMAKGGNASFLDENRIES